MIIEDLSVTDKPCRTSKYYHFFCEYYYVLIGLLFIFAGILNLFLKYIKLEYTGYIFVLAFASFTARLDLRRDVKVKPFILLSIPYIMFILIILANGNDIWHRVILWEMKKQFFININNFFKSIPFNDASFARIYQPVWLTKYMLMVYGNGFVLSAVIPLFRAVVSLDYKKMLRYSLSAHIFQVFIVTPFYMTFYLNNVWFVYGHADPLSRGMTKVEAAVSTLNGLPSMHTSIAFAMFLLALRERNKIFKWVWCIYCISIIYSTMYLEIHWVIDVLAGLLVGYLTVKLVDYIIAKVDINFARLWDRTYYKKKDTVVIEQGSSI